jgi:TolB-like protein/Flp pilus assembly protein TadD
MDVLVYLASEPGRLVSKEELLEAVWGGSFVEEGALSQAIHSLRKALGDDARQPRYIRTIPKRGYRLVVPVSYDEGNGRAWASVEAPSPSGPEPQIPSRGFDRRRLLFLTSIGIVIAIAILLAWKYLEADRNELMETGSAVNDGIRIVVLPFENIGTPENDFFTDGLTEEITKDLASLSPLQVISRNSAMRYKGGKKPLSKIGQELGVDYVLDGTVRWAEGSKGRPRVRITPKLIRVKDDVLTWAQSFDREVEDIFEVQAEISRRVITQLSISLLSERKRELGELPTGSLESMRALKVFSTGSPERRRTLGVPPTGSLEAYRAYLQGLELKRKSFYSKGNVQSTAEAFERAVKLDPNFAAAWAELSQAYSSLFNANQSPMRIEKAKQALDRAITLSPDAPSARLAQACFSYRCWRDLDSAYKQLTEAARLFPNDVEILQTLGLVLRHRGQMRPAVETLQRAFSRDPYTGELVWTIAETYRALRDFEQADRYYSQAITLAPDQPSFWEEMALNRLMWTGDLEEARSILKKTSIPEDPRLVPIAFQLDFYEREYGRALARLTPERMRELTLVEQSRLATLAAIARDRLGNHHSALAAAEANRLVLEARVSRFPDDPFFRAYLAVALAQLGREAEALSQVKQAVHQERHDAFYGPRIVQIQAMVDVILGRRREAMNRLNWLLSTPYKSSISPVDLRLDPVWDTLRTEPAFEHLVQKFGG